MRLKKPAVALCMVASLALAGVSSSVAANNSNQQGLVNVSTGDVALLNGVNLAVAANVIATVCDVTVPVAVLAQQVVANGGATYCQANIGVVANVLVTACDVTVPVAVLAAQAVGDTGTTVCTTAAGPITLTQSQ